MADPIWPVGSEMPQDIQIDGTATYQDNIISFEPDKGQSIDRARFLAVSQFFTGAKVILSSTANYTAVQKLTALLSFWESDITFGALKFDWKHPITQAARKCKIKNLSYKSLSNSSGSFEVTFDLEVLPT